MVQYHHFRILIPMVFQHQRSRGFQWWVETSWINHGMAIFMAFIIMAIVEIMGFKYVLTVFNHVWLFMAVMVVK